MSGTKVIIKEKRSAPAGTDPNFGGDGGIRTHVPVTRQTLFESAPLRPLRYISIRYKTGNQSTIKSWDSARLGGFSLLAGGWLKREIQEGVAHGLQSFLEPGQGPVPGDDDRHPFMDVREGGLGFPGQDDKDGEGLVNFLPETAGQEEGTLGWGKGKALFFALKGLPFVIAAGRDQAAVVLHGLCKEGLVQGRLRPGVDDQAVVKSLKAPLHDLVEVLARLDGDPVLREDLASGLKGQGRGGGLVLFFQLLGNCQELRIR